MGGTGGFPAPPKRALVERQEPGPEAGELRGHEHLFRVHGEVGEAASVGEEGLSRVPVVLVLPDRILHVLPVERVLQLGREDGNAVQEEGEVDALLGLLAKAKLAHNGEEVGSVQALQLLVEPARRAEVRQPETCSLSP